MPDDRQVDQLPNDVVTEPALLTAGRARRILLNRPASDPRVLLGDCRTGDRQPELHGPDDGVSN